MARIGSVVGWFLGTYPGRVIQAYATSQAGNYAGTLAFNAFISMFPLILGLLTVLGLTVHSPQAKQQFLSGALAFFPSDSQAALSAGLTTVQKNTGLLGVVAILGFLWSGSSLFTSMEWVLGRMVGARQRDFLRQRLMALLMTLAYVVAVVGSIGLNAAVAVAQGFPLAGPVAGLAVWLLFMLAVYRLVPNRTYRLRRLWRGALLAGGLMEVLTLLWPLYTGLTHNFSTYGAAFALFFVLATWLYFFSQFILLGAVVNRMHCGAPTCGGLICAPEPDRLETEATRAADQFGRRRRAA
jgi:membrane protein